MAEERRNRLSPAGRLRSAAAGRQNLQRWKDAQPAASAIRAAATAFQAGLDRDFGADSTSAALALRDVATASYTAILIVSGRLLTSRRLRHLESFLDLLARHEGVLLRALRSLGADVGSADDGALADILERYGAKRKEATDGETDANRNTASAE